AACSWGRQECPPHPSYQTETLPIIPCWCRRGCELLATQVLALLLRRGADGDGDAHLFLLAGVGIGRFDAQRAMGAGPRCRRHLGGPITIDANRDGKRNRTAAAIQRHDDGATGRRRTANRSET